MRRVCTTTSHGYSSLLRSAPSHFMPWLTCWLCYFSWYMGLDELTRNGITTKVLYFLTDRAMTPYDEPLHCVHKSCILLSVAMQLIAFGTTFAITQTIGTPASLLDVLTSSVSNWHIIFLLHHVVPATVGFLVIILLLIPLWTLVVPCFPFCNMELEILNRPTTSPFISC